VDSRRSLLGFGFKERNAKARDFDFPGLLFANRSNPQVLNIDFSQLGQRVAGR
jgi:hypothetical protein